MPGQHHFLLGRRVPEGVIVALLHVSKSELGNTTDEILGQWIGVPDLKDARFCRFVLFQFVAKRLEACKHRGKAEVGFVRRKGEQESRLDKKGRTPLDRLFGVGGDALENGVQPMQMRMAVGRRCADIFGDGTQVCLVDGGNEEVDPVDVSG